MFNKKKPTFLKVYAFPVLLFNLLFAAWGLFVAHSSSGWLAYMGYALIVTVGLYVYLMYLDRYLY